ncbi:MAG TPA: protein kinase [Kofleriaceae bacterium]|nr:protein kinase [Kofleriaceae bacterium]
MVSTAGSGLPGALESSDVLLPGAKAGPWIVERELGRGGMGAVYAVIHEEIGKRAALKVVHQRLLVQGFNCDRMLLEARVVNQVGHPNIVDIFETGQFPGGRPYIVMERLEGQALSARADEGKLLPDLVIAILLQVCDALVAAHAAGVVHRDLKLDNVFLVDNPDDPATPRAKLLDWGIAKVLSHDVRHTIEGQLVGTPQYLSPEQARGAKVTPQTDVYSLGVMAYELFLEQLPFEAETAAEVMAMHLRANPPPPRDLWPEIPQALEELLLDMLGKQPELRPSMLEVARRLEAVRDELNRRRQIVIVPGRATGPRLAAVSRARGTPASGAPVETPLPVRVVSSEGLARTYPAGRVATPRWQYILGACALVASALLFWVSRVGDRAASAATTTTAAAAASTPTLAPALAPGSPHAAQTSVTGAARDAMLAGDPEPPAAAHTPDPQAFDRERPPASASNAAALAQPAPAAPDAPGARRASTRPTRVELASAARPAATRTAPPRVSASRPTPARQPPVVPRRGAKVDPDGTFDAYR